MNATDLYINGRCITELPYNDLRKELIDRGIHIERSPTKVVLFNQLVDALLKEKKAEKKLGKSIDISDLNHPLYKNPISESELESIPQNSNIKYKENYNHHVKELPPVSSVVKLTSNSNVLINLISYNNNNSKNNNNNKKRKLEDNIEAGSNNYKVFLNSSEDEEYFGAFELYQKISSRINFQEIIERIGFEDSLAYQIVVEYIKFIVLRIRVNDLDLTILHPPPLIQILMKHHILDIKKYLEFIKLIQVQLNSNPDVLDVVVEDEEENQILSKRYEYTLDLYRKIFFKINSNIWPCSWKECLKLTFNKIKSYSIINHQNNNSNN